MRIDGLTAVFKHIPGHGDRLKLVSPTNEARDGEDPLIIPAENPRLDAHALQRLHLGVEPAGNTAQRYEDGPLRLSRSIDDLFEFSEEKVAAGNIEVDKVGGVAFVHVEVQVGRARREHAVNGWFEEGVLARQNLLAQHKVPNRRVEEAYRPRKGQILEIGQEDRNYKHLKAEQYSVEHE